MKKIGLSIFLLIISLHLGVQTVFACGPGFYDCNKNPPHIDGCCPVGPIDPPCNCDDGYHCNANKKCVKDNAGGGGGDEDPATCSPTCETYETCSSSKKCVPKYACDPKCKDTEYCNAEKKCVVNPKCSTFVSGSIAPVIIKPYDLVTVKCNYGKRLDCLSVTGAGLKNCRYSRYEGESNIFVCDAGVNTGYYDDVKCTMEKGTADRCCTGTSKAGNMTILGTDVQYNQDVVLPFKKVDFSARVWTVISKNKGVRIQLICNSDTCANGTKKNATLFSIPFPVSRVKDGFVVSTKQLDLKGTGDDRHYIVRISVDKGSEMYIDYISMKDPQKRELLRNGDFTTNTNTTIEVTQPVAWGEGDNKVGYYYGSLATSAPEPEPTSAPNPTGGAGGGTPGNPATVSLALKIKLQGIAKKPAKADAINVKVKLGGGGLTAATAYKTVSFTVNDVGEWSGKAEFANVPVGGGYRVYIKGPKHIAKKICDAAPTEAKGGEYHCSDGKITLKAGENILDFSKIIQMGGDLPENGTQNGIIDAFDTTFIRANLGTTDSAKIIIGDINLDGGIDTQDYSIILQALSIKFDEE